MRCILFVLLLTTPVTASVAAPLGSEFTFQGRLEQDNNPVSGDYELELVLFDAQADGSPIAGPISRNVAVVDGLFSVQLDFGDGPFGGEQRWLQVSVRAAGDSEFVTLSPRQAITATPYALHAQNVGDSAVSSTEIVDGSITAADVDTSQLQRRITDSCPAGESIRAVAQDGTVTCEPDTAGGSGFWDLTPEGGIISEYGASITPADTAVPLSLVRDSHPSTPHLSLTETSANDFSRINFYTSNNPERFWAMAGRVGASAVNDTLNFYNSGAGQGGGGVDILTVSGTRSVGVNDSTPLAPLTVRSQDNWRPQTGNGLGDFHVGDEQVGLSIGVALGGGGRGTTRVWTNTQGGLILTTENSSGGIVIHDAGVRVEELTHAGPDNRAVAVESNGNLVLGPPATSSAVSLFGHFGGDGSDGNLVLENPGTVNMGNLGQVLRKQYQTLTIGSSTTLHLRSRYSFIAVQGECYLGGEISAVGSGMPGAPPAGNDEDGQDGVSARVYTDLCVSGSGGGGQPTAHTNPGVGGSAEGITGETDPVKRAVLSAGVAFYQTPTVFDHPGETHTDAFSQLLMCPGAGGGAGASGPGMTGGAGGAGGGVIYIECGTINGVGQVNAQGAQPQSGTGGGGEGGVGGGGVVLVRTLREKPNDVVLWDVNVQSRYAGADVHPRNGAPGYGDVVIVD